MVKSKKSPVNSKKAERSCKELLITKFVSNFIVSCCNDSSDTVALEKPFDTFQLPSMQMNSSFSIPPPVKSECINNHPYCPQPKVICHIITLPDGQQRFE
eukprot:TRINITY_DN556_c0_g2_i21.p1 TRINITY_DN556_c0_g2~~TRINITY_DN556_c0_g2_i21.p1  ORF type:complete len:100 (+),score=13.94 TRINITY_DN556_c0_g2_i21:110-409(+)